ncbi:MAG: hypothetical protein K8R37_09105 [Bacteroidales bacterium]|nr:hypothetical protein [Bacteroidales bacterium]
MKNLLKKIGLAIIGLSVIILLDNCGSGGGGTSTNEYLGKLPGIAKKYTEKIDKKKKELKECTDMGKAFKLDEEVKSLGDEANKIIEEHLANNPLNALPFEQKTDYPFTINEVSVNTKYNSSISRLQLITKVKIDQDIKNEYGGFERTIFAYVTAVDKEGNFLTKKPGVFSSGFKKQEFKKGMDVALEGTIDDVKNLGKFDKFVFISREEYDKLK